jgi:LmbE family N-acetylglucosaminyl deacetylase
VCAVLEPPSQLKELPEDWERVLAVAAHPDDVEYEAGGAIARWSADGRKVTFLLASRGEAGITTMPPAEAAAVREAEQRASAKAIGAETVEFLDHPDGVIEYSLRLRRAIAGAIRRHRPELLVVQNHHYYWPGRQHLNMADHRVVGLATLDAARDAANRWVFPELSAAGLEPWTGIKHIAISCSPYSTHAVDVTRSLSTAITALREHRVYLNALVDDDLSADMADPGDWLLSQAAKAALRFNGRLAETFEVISI